MGVFTYNGAFRKLGNNVRSKNPYTFIAPWLIWGLAAFFFFAHYVVRVTPGQISEELEFAFHITKTEMGLLGASFYLPYVLMQMPVGYLVDRFGSRLLLTLAVLVCSASSFIFASAVMFDMAILSRVLLGFCSATAFIGALKLITVWFEPRKLALLVGITQALGMLGAATGAGLVPYLTDAVGWRGSFYVFGFMFLILSALIYAFVRNRPANESSMETTHSSLKFPNISLKQVLLNRYTWINALYAGFIYAPTDVMGELWGREFLRNIHGLHPHTASMSISFLFIGWGIGGPLAGWLADHLGRRPVMILSAIIGLMLLPIIFYIPHLSAPLILVLLFIYGLTNTGLIASYAAAGELHDKSQAGFSMAIANMLSVLLGALLMPLLGWLLEWQAKFHMTDGLMVFIPKDYERATLVLPLCMLLALLCALFSRETLIPAASPIRRG